MLYEDRTSKNWAYPSRLELHKQMDKLLYKHQYKHNAKHYWYIDWFFSKTKLSTHYTNYLNQLSPHNQKAFKGTLLNLGCELMRRYLANPQQWGYIPENIAVRTMSMWSSYFMRKYNGMLHYTGKLSKMGDYSLSGFSNGYQLDKRLMFMESKRVTEILFYLADKIYKHNARIFTNNIPKEKQ